MSKFEDQSTAPICVLGMHRSGTSCLTGALEQAGVNLGEVVDWARYNRKGNKESRELRSINADLLRANGGTWNKPPEKITWNDEFRARRDEFLAQVDRSGPWGFKDPRTVLTLDFWLEALPEMRFVGTFRDPVAVAMSLMARPKWPEDVNPIDTWIAYNRLLLKQCQTHAVPLISFDLPPDEYQKRLVEIAKGLGLKDADKAVEFFETDLRSAQTRKKSADAFSDNPSLAEAKKLYQQLEEQSRKALPTPIVAASKPRHIYRPDPYLGWSLAPGARVEVPFRDDVVQNIGADGWRHVPNQAAETEPNLGVYGCSFTYGTGLTDQETFAARLQAALPDIRVNNRGVGGFSTVQNLLQFKKDIADGRVDMAVFAVINNHRFRNIAHPNRMVQFLNAEWHERGVEHVPVMRQGRDSEFRIEYVSIWQPALEHSNFDVFLPDTHMIDMATLRVLSEVAETAKANGIPLCFALLEDNDKGFCDLVCAHFEQAVDISVPNDATHRFLPHDAHPNAHSNALYAERLLPVVSEMIGNLAKKDA